MRTYHAGMRPDGTLYCEGHGIHMGTDGETASWMGQGVGTFEAGGAISYRGALYLQPSSPKWARLNSVAAVFEYEQEANGNSKGQTWEWK